MEDVNELKYGEEMEIDEEMKDIKEDDDNEIKGIEEDDDENNEIIYLKSKEGELVTVKSKDASISILIKTIIEGDKQAGLKEDYAIPLSLVSTNHLKLIVEYMTYHNGEDTDIPPQPVRSTDMYKVCKNPKDAEFCNNLVETKNNEVDLNQLFEIILVANYLDMKALLYKLCAKVATQLKGKDSSEIPKILESVSKFRNNDELKE